MARFAIIEATVTMSGLRQHKFSLLIAAKLLTLTVLAVSFMAIPSNAEATAGGEHLVTIHDRGKSKTILTKQTTLREVLREANYVLDANDMVEPSLDEELVARDYQVNIYRARPIIIHDGAIKQLVMSPHQTPKQIAKDAGITLQDEDEAALSLTDHIVRDGASIKMTIDRATPVTLVLYGKKQTVYTQATTIADFLKEKGITVGEKDTLSVKTSQSITKDMKIEIWRNGKQTVTREEPIDFEVEQIEDVNRPVGYRKITEPGVRGKKTVTYEVTMKNGKELKRKKIQSVVIKKPSKQVEIVGAKPSFSGDFAEALAKLRSCEGGYDSWNPAGPYYGAYQFDEGTWNGVSDAPYGNATPAEQDAAARKLYERRGWQPWPVCGANLPDTYR